MRRVLLTICMVLGSLTLSGCWFKKKPKVQAPPPPVQAPRAAQTTPTPSPKKAPPKRKQVSSTPRAGQPAAPPRSAEVNKPIPMPKTEDPQRFGQILSAEEKTQYRTMYERSSTAARDILKNLTARELAGDALASVGRIRSFLAQAQEAATTDLSAAAQLAYRAEVLARDLARFLQ
ncbi:MAG TPA: hypothetical protein VEX68_29450 [Bryobacteraceae bacterium]|nr:hypothetical protein [Bryobacteraceae bacterium]